MSDTEVSTPAPATAKRKLAETATTPFEYVAAEATATFLANLKLDKSYRADSARDLLANFEGIYTETEAIFKRDGLPLTNIEVSASQALESLASPDLLRRIFKQSTTHLFLINARKNCMHRAFTFHAGTSFVRALAITCFLGRFKCMLAEEGTSNGHVVLMFDVLEKAIVLSKRVKPERPTCREIAAMIDVERLPQGSRDALPGLIEFVAQMNVPCDTLRGDAGRSYQAWDIVGGDKINELAGNCAFHTNVEFS